MRLSRPGGVAGLLAGLALTAAPAQAADPPERWRQLRPPQRRGLQWRLISHLSLNYLSLVNGGLDALQEILKLYDFTDNPGIQKQIARGATEDQAVASVKLDQYSKLYAFAGQREVVLRRIYKELKGTLQ